MLKRGGDIVNKKAEKEILYIVKLVKKAEDKEMFYMCSWFRKKEEETLYVVQLIKKAEEKEMFYKLQWV